MQRQKQAMQRRETDLARLSEAVQGAAVRRFTDAETSLRHAAAMAESLNPYGVLARGYAMVEKDGAVSEVAALQPATPSPCAVRPSGRLRGAERAQKRAGRYDPMKQPKSFEEGLTRLQELLTALQDESTPLAQSVKLYAEAAGLISYCKQTLDAAKLQINEIDASLLVKAEDVQ